MQLGVFQLLAARREQLDMDLARVDTLREYWTAVAELHALIAGRQVQPERRDPGDAMVSANERAGGGH